MQAQTQALTLTYYVLPFKKDTLLSLLEEPGWAGLKVTCLTPQPGEEEEE